MIIQSLDYHRNGCSGAGYYVARLVWRGDARKYTGTAIIFDREGHIAVTTSDGATGFRAEDFEPELRAFIASDAGQAMAFPRLSQAVRS